MFMSCTVHKLYRLLKIPSIHTSIYHQQTGGLFVDDKCWLPRLTGLNAHFMCILEI